MSRIAETVHGTLVVLGERGVLILGASGKGKSSLAMALLARGTAAGLHARLVGDDRVRILVQGQRLVGRGHPVLTGHIEARGVGLLQVEAADAAIVQAVILLDEASPRLPEAPQNGQDILGIWLPRLTLKPDQDLVAKADLVLDWLSRHFAIAKNS